MEIKIIGTDCSNGMKLLKMVTKAIGNIDKKFDVKNLKKDKKYGITNYPALIINNNIVSEGKVLTEREIRRIILAN